MPRTLYVKGTDLLTLPGVKVYRYHKNQFTEIENFDASDVPHNHYEVSQPVDGDGSWWLHTGTHVSEKWGGWEYLKLKNKPPTQLVRPRQLYFWIPKAAWAASHLVLGATQDEVDDKSIPQHAPW